MTHIEDRWTSPGKDGRERNARWGSGKRWRARWVEANGKERSKAFTTKADAELWVSRVEVDTASGTYVNHLAGRILFRTWARDWMATKVHRKPTTIAGYESLLKVHILPTWGDVPLNRMRHVELQQWIARMNAEGLSASRVRQASGLVHQVMDAAVRSKLIVGNPCVGLDLPRLPDPGRTFLTHDQVLAVANECGEYRTLVLVLAYTGLRWGEATSLTMADVDVLRRRIQVSRSVSQVSGAQHVGPPKGHRVRQVAVPAFIDLAGAVAGKRPADLVFADTQGGYLRGSNFLRRVWYPALVQAGVPRITVHELRHTAASLAIAAGADVKVVQHMLGHASGAMTLDVYGHLLDDRLDAVAEALSAGAAESETAHRRPKGSGAVIPFPVRKQN